MVDHLPRLAGSGIVYTLTVADAERLASAVREVHGDTVPVAAYTGQLDAVATTRARGRAARQPAQGAGVDVRARHGLRQARPRVRRPRRGAALAGVVLPAGRTRGPRHRPRARRAAALRRRRGRVGVLRHRDHPGARAGALGARRPRPLTGRADERAGHRGADGCAPRPRRADAQAAGRRRGRRPCRGRLGRHRRRVVLRPRALRRRGGGPPARGRHHARLRARRALPDGAVAGVARRPRRRAVRPLLGVPRRAARGAGRRAVGRDGRDGDRAAPRPGARARAAQDVARRRVRLAGPDPAPRRATPRAAPSSSPMRRSGARRWPRSSPATRRHPPRSPTRACGCSPSGARPGRRGPRWSSTSPPPGRRC